MCLKGDVRVVHKLRKRAPKLDFTDGKQPLDTILGWRVWKVESLFPLRLRSQSQTDVWIPGKPMDGDPEKGGNLGVHCYFTVSELLSGGYAAGLTKTDFKQQDVVVGQCVLWGKVAEHDNGYRGEHGYPFMLYANGFELQRRLRENYKCDVGIDFVPRILAA